MNKAMNAVVMALLIVPLWIVALLNNIPWHSKPDTIVVTPQGASQGVQWSFRDQEQAKVFADRAWPAIDKLGGSLPRREGATVKTKLPITRTLEGSVVSLPTELIPAGGDWALRVRLSPYHEWETSAGAVSMPALGYVLVEVPPTATVGVALAGGFLPTAMIYFGGWVLAAFLCAVALAFRVKSRPPEQRKSVLATYSGLSQVPATLGLAMSSVTGLFESLSVQVGTILAGIILLASICPVIFAGIFPLRSLAREAGRADTWASRSVALVLQVTPLLLFLIIRVSLDAPLTWIAGKLTLGTWGVASLEIIVYALAVALAPLITLRLLPLTHSQAAPAMGKQSVLSYRVLPVGDSGMANAFVVGFFPGSVQFVVTDRLVNELTSDELHAVLAHEKGHVHHWHLVKLQAIYLAVVVGIRAMIGIGPWGGSSAWAAGVAGLAALPLALLVTLHWSKVFEFQADRFAATSLAPMGATALSKALQRLYALNGGASLPDVFLTHPSLEARLRALDGHKDGADRRNA